MNMDIPHLDVETVHSQFNLMECCGWRWKVAGQGMIVHVCKNLLWNPPFIECGQVHKCICGETLDARPENQL